MNEVIQKISKNDPVNDTNLIIIYNIIEYIIEYYKRYLKSRKDQSRFLIEYLEKISGHEKTVENSCYINIIVDF